MIRVGIVGATGYAGGELVRILMGHKEVEIKWYGSRSYIDKKYYEMFRNMFQIVDDILDVTATAEALGKPVGSDAENEKVTYVSLLGLEEARRLAAARTETALAALAAFDADTAALRQLAQALLTRDH